MAAPTDTGFGETVELETGLGLSAEDPIGFDEKNGGEDEEVQVAKKPRVEKAENGDATAEVDGDGDGVESVKKDVTDPELEAHNGNEKEERINGEGDEEDVSAVAVAEDAEDVDSVGDDTAAAPEGTGKDASSGDGGLRTLLQEGEPPKAGIVNGTEDAAHILNGAK